MKKVLSLLLALITVLIVFTIVPFSVSAVTVDFSLGDFDYNYVNGGVEIARYHGDDTVLSIPKKLIIITTPTLLWASGTAL